MGYILGAATDSGVRVMMMREQVRDNDDVDRTLKKSVGKYGWC